MFGATDNRNRQALELIDSLEKQTQSKFGMRLPIGS